MTEWSTLISTFLSFVSVAFILIAVGFGSSLSQDLGENVYGRQIASSNVIRDEYNGDFVIGESLTREDASREMIERRMGNYCQRILIFEGYGTMTSPASFPLSTAVSMSGVSHNRDAATSAQLLKSQIEGTYNSYQLDNKWRLMYSTQNAYPAHQTDCYYFIDYEGLN